MTESEQIDRSKLDPEVAPKLVDLKKKHEVEILFQVPRIEDVALKTIEDLDELEKSLPEDELDEVCKGEDVLVNIYNTDQFVGKNIIPLVFELMERTNQTIFMTDSQVVGYSFILLDEEYDNNGEEQGVSFVIDDKPNDIFMTLDEPEDMQEAWDTCPKKVRSDLQAFAGISKREIISRFYDFVFEYANL
jgi:hypothetical protein